MADCCTWKTEKAFDSMTSGGLGELKIGDHHRYYFDLGPFTCNAPLFLVGTAASCYCSFHAERQSFCVVMTIAHHEPDLYTACQPFEQYIRIAETPTEFHQIRYLLLSSTLGDIYSHESITVSSTIVAPAQSRRPSTPAEMVILCYARQTNVLMGFYCLCRWRAEGGRLSDGLPGCVCDIT